MTTWQLTDNRLDFSITRTVVASKESVYQVLADMEAYPEFINDLVSVKREGNLYHFAARAAILTIPATVTVSEVPDQSISFEMIKGPLKQLSGQWLVEEGQSPEQTKVTLMIQAESGFGGKWILRMTAKFIENKSDKLITHFIDRVLEREKSRGAREQGGEGQGGGGAGEQGGEGTEGAKGTEEGEGTAFLFGTEAQQQTLAALAATILPADDFDGGLSLLDLIEVVEMRARYETGRAELYATALIAVDQLAQARFNGPSFIDLAPPERAALLEALRHNQADGNSWGQHQPADFFSALWEDVVFLYCTQPETWERIGFPGPSFEKGGYPDVEQPQQFLGKQESQ